MILTHQPTFADAIAAIERAADLSPAQKIHWTCSVRRIATALDRPMISLIARPTAVCMAVRSLHHAQLGMTRKTRANHRANLWAALRWFCKTKGVPTRGARLML